ncbi:1-acyl-sn-glycerol-3-phosphate acyltransferase [Christensenellaceae bacterium OttesenSCG-928-L17]|nr:1-acyl-sn-glycerol-3-phosphate acyltransferase [Christensenellaceae bacterium OttesenSCG-928-L17]
MKVRDRHILQYKYLRKTVKPFLKRLFRFEYEEVQCPEGPTLVLVNHVMDLDPALVALSFPQHMYFVASEHVYRLRVISMIIRYLLAPIARVKGRRDARTVAEVFRALKGGSNVCIFAEGNRTFNGETGEILSSTGKMVYKSGANLVTYRIEGGYLTQPRWAKSLRRGHTRGRVVGMYTAETLREMTAEQVNALIVRDLYEDAYARQRENPIPYKGKSLAEDIQIAAYICPHCKQIGTIKSYGSRFSCACGMQGVYTEYGFLEGELLPFTTMIQWDAWQMEELKRIVDAAGSEPIFSSINQNLFMVEPGVRNRLLVNGTLQIYKDRICFEDYVFEFSEISDMAIYGRMTLVFSSKQGNQYEIKSSYPRSACVYYQIYLLMR